MLKYLKNILLKLRKKKYEREKSLINKIEKKIRLLNEKQKNSNIEIINKDSKIKWKIDKNLKILTYEKAQKGEINIDNTIVGDNNKVTFLFFYEKKELTC